jgi:SAM-dependent methyltransferase
MSNVSDDDGYLLDNQQTGAEERLNALSELFDPITFRHLNAMGIGPGWRCWEVGAGGPTVAAWMAGHVGPTGRVLATDIDVTWLPAHAEFDVLRHDVGRQPPPATGFDLIHARLVLVHTPQRQAALASLIGALRPGGQLLVEDADPGLQPLLCPDESGPDQVLANRLREGFRSLMRERGADLAFGRTLPRRLREAGLVDVQADAYFPIASPACMVLERTTITQIRQQLVERRLATEADIERHLANVATGRMDLATSPLISAWGRSQ